MKVSPPSNWSLFRTLCQIVGGQDAHSLRAAFNAGLMPQLLILAREQDVLPSLAIRCQEQLSTEQCSASPEYRDLQEALHENTLVNMQISAQALDLAKTLNSAGITPLFLKGTVQLLSSHQQNLGQRKQIDIDFLVEPNHIESAADALLASGYGFRDRASGYSQQQRLYYDTPAALKHSESHHHLPALVKEGYATTVELHRHFLPKQFQKTAPLEPLFTSAIELRRNGITYRTPSAQYQMINLLLGKIVHDGHLARRRFPLREACDYIWILQQQERDIDQALVERLCGKSYRVFSALIAELMSYQALGINAADTNITRQLNELERRCNSPHYATLMNGYARVLHLGKSLLHNPGKLRAYLHRLYSNQHSRTAAPHD